MNKLVIFDVDGTLVKTKSGDQFRKTADDWEFLPGRIETVQGLIKSGMKVGIATNQGGVAFGKYTIEDMSEELMTMRDSLEGDTGGDIQIEACMSHPHASLEQYRDVSGFRKPGPGMLYLLMGLCDPDRPIRPSETLMVGDRVEDKQAAQAAGCQFKWSHVFFGDNEA